MDSTIFYPRQEPQPEELTVAQQDAQWTELKRFGLVYSPGIFPAHTLYETSGDTARWGAYHDAAFGSVPFGFRYTPGDQQFDIGPGIAFAPHQVSELPTVADYGTTNPDYVPQDDANPTDRRMERIFIAPASAVSYNADNASATDSLGNPIPKSSGSLQIPVSPAVSGTVTRYVYIRYLRVAETTTDIGADPQNDYTVSPSTGAVNYVHWGDGYSVRVSASADGGTNEILLGTLTANTVGITGHSYAGRQYSTINGSLVSSMLTPGATSAYEAGSPVDLYNHINAVNDVTAVSATNPHGITVNSLAGLNEAIGIYGNNPENFHTNGVVAWNAVGAGPFWGNATSRSVSGDSTATVALTLPGASQFLYIYNKGFTQIKSAGGSSYYFSERRIASTDNLELQGTASGDGSVFCDFVIGAARPSGFYCVYAQALDENPVGSGTPFNDPNPPGNPLQDTEGNNLFVCVVKAVKIEDISAPVDTILSGLPTLLSTATGLNAARTYPIAVVCWDGLFQSIHDPQTDTDVLSIDVRAFGTIGTEDLLAEKRYTTALGTPVRDLVVIDHDVQANSLTVTGRTSEMGGFVMPPGVVLPYAGSVAPPGFLMCNGAALSKTADSGKYLPLFNVIGYTYGGAGDTFNLPNPASRGLMFAGSGSGLTSRALGATGGAETVRLRDIESGMPTHVVPVPFAPATGGLTPDGTIVRPGTTNVTIPGVDAAQAHDNMSPWFAFNGIIKY